VNDYHRANMIAKAQRAMTTICLLIDQVFIPDPDVPEVTDRLTGLYMMSQELIARNSPAMWHLIGQAHDRRMGVDRFGAVTEFKTSREFLFPLIATAIENAQQPHTGDPFEGLTR
jgi:hypothetical protein